MEQTKRTIPLGFIINFEHFTANAIEGELGGRIKNSRINAHPTT
jgi:hypothetical protein